MTIRRTFGNGQAKSRKTWEYLPLNLNIKYPIKPSYNRTKEEGHNYLFQNENYIDYFNLIVVFVSTALLLRTFIDF